MLLKKIKPFNFLVCIFVMFFLKAYADEKVEIFSNEDSEQWNIIDEKDSNKTIKWQNLIINNNAKNREKIIWKLINNDNFKNKNLEHKYIERIEKNKKTNQRVKKKKKNYFLTEMDPYLPLNNFLDDKEIRSSVRWKSSFDGGASNGIGQQNPSFVVDYGLSDTSMISIYATGADDDLYNLIEGQNVNYYWQSYGFAYKKKLIDEKKYNFAFSIAPTLEYWRTASGSETSKSIFNQKDDLFGKEKFENIVGSISFPFSKNFSKRFTLFLTPGITFLPESLGTKNIGKNAYGNNFYLGSGFILNPIKDINLLTSYTTSLGPGNNYFDNNLHYSRKPIYSFGIGWDINPKIGVEGKISNSYGSSPATGILTIPSDNLPVYSANLIYRPYQDDVNLKSLSINDEIISHGGIIVNNALLPAAGTSQVHLNYDSEGNWFGLYGYSLSNIFQLELLNIGSFKGVNLSKDKNNGLQSTYLSKDNLNYRLGGKLLIFSPQKNDPFWMTFRTSFGRNNYSNQGYLYSEFLNTFKINDRVFLNLSPKYIFSGIKSFGGIGLSSYISLYEKLVLIPEINGTFSHDDDLTSSIALRYSYKPRKSIDLYYSNAVGIQDIGQLIEEKEYKFGIKLNFLF